VSHYKSNRREIAPVAFIPERYRRSIQNGFAFQGHASCGSPRPAASSGAR
jgi:hypothetical protein